MSDFEHLNNLVDFGNIEEEDAIAIGNILQEYQSQAITIKEQAVEIKAKHRYQKELGGHDSTTQEGIGVLDSGGCEMRHEWMIKVRHVSGHMNLLTSIRTFKTRQRARNHINNLLRARFKGGSVAAIWPVKVKLKYEEITT